MHINKICSKANQQLGMLKRSLNCASETTKLILFNGIVRPVLEYASQVWSPQRKNDINRLDRIHRNGIKWVYRMGRAESVRSKMETESIMSLEERREALDTNFLTKIECQEYFIDLKHYINFNSQYNTRHGTINPHFRYRAFKESFYCRMRSQVKLNHYNCDA